jgi:hypothetical protein
VNVLNVNVEHFTVQEPFGDVGIQAIVGGIPVAIVKVPQQNPVYEKNAKRQDPGSSCHATM